MNDRIIAQSSLTYAYKGEAILRQKGIAVSIVRLTSGRTAKGCNYGLSVPQEQLSRAVGILKGQGAFVGEIL